MKIPSVSVIIPTRNAGNMLGQLLSSLQEQTLRPSEIIVADTSSEDQTTDCLDDFPQVRLVSVAREEFDHGGTRDACVRMTTGDIICFFTQDALPANKDCLQALVTPLEDSAVACTYGRQLPKPEARPEERLTRAYNYPPGSEIHTLSDLPRLGIKTYFCSDVCSAYRRSAYEAAGGFAYPIVTNEDMLMAARLIHKGYSVAYAADACVLHSHNLSIIQDYRRSFDIGAFLHMYQEELHCVSADREGMAYVRSILCSLVRKGRIAASVRFLLHCGARFCGSRAGKRYQSFSLRGCLRRSSNARFWKTLE